MEKDELRYLADSTNNLYRILSETIKPSEDDFRKVFAVSCNTLSRLVEEKKLFADLKLLAKRQKDFTIDYRKITDDVKHFVDGFCNIEREVLIAAGVEPDAAKALILEGINLRKDLIDLKIDPDRVFRDLSELRDEACEIAQHLHGLPAKRIEERLRKKKLKKFFYAIGGVTIVAADTGAFALSLGMSLAGTAVSGSFGCGFVGAALAID